MAESLNRFHLQRLRTEVRPFRVHYFSSLRSTNLHAARMRREGRIFAPAIVLTGKQTAGRGRGANTWFSASGSLTVTFVLPIDAHEPHQLPLIVGLAARRACAQATGRDEIKLKWPNDLLFEGKKLAGLLCQRVNGADLVGIGINVNMRLTSAPIVIRKQITSLQEIAGRKMNLNDVLIGLSRHLRQVLRQRGQKTFAAFVEEYRQYDALSGRQIEVIGDAGERPLKGVCQGIDSNGRLLLRDRAKTHHIIAGHVLMGSHSNSRRKYADMM